MGGLFSISIPCDQVVNQVSQCLCLRGSYIHNLSKNLATLKNDMETLLAKRDDVQGRVDSEEFTGRRRMLSQVEVWLTSILTLENQYSDLLTTSELELQRLCLCGFCSKNLKSSYRYGERVVVMLSEVKSLSFQGEFSEVTKPAPIAEAEELPIQPTIVGQETMLDEVWSRLMGDKVEIVGLYGMGGVGKTTLLTQINNKLSEISGGFDVVIWVVVSKNATVHKIQGDLAEKIGLGGKEWDEKNESKRAIYIYNVLKRKKFVLFLDDIWEKVNLSLIGVPYPSSENRCKVAFTTRSRDVCGRMGVDDPIQVRCLDMGKAWDLFEKKVGENTLRSHPDIPELARKVAEKCRGLPLALNVIGETMACKTTVQEWHRAIDILTSYAAEFEGVEDKILPILKYSYDNLHGEQVQSCFLYCSLFPEDRLIDKDELIEYWIGEGFIDEKEGRERALGQGYEILGTLVRACLLMDAELFGDMSRVYMHDVVRDMALWIASDLGKDKEKWIVQAGVGLREIPKVKNWKNVGRLSLMGNKIKKISKSFESPQLTTLLLGENKLSGTMSGGFFQSKLLVLDLSWNQSLSRLPEEISRLVSLRYLNLSWTKIKQLPVGLQELKMLIHLNLECTGQLESLHGISKLSSLRTLKLRDSKVWLDMSLMKELQLLEDLEFVSVCISSSLVAEPSLYDPRVLGRCIQNICIKERRREESVGVLVLPAMDNLRQVDIWDCGMWEIKIEKTPWNKNPTSPCFSNLFSVTIYGCNGLKDLTWLLFAPNLTNLIVRFSKQVEEIISKEKAASVLEKEACNILPFLKLEQLLLSDLPELKSIYWNALPFLHLRILCILNNCGKLRKLPLDSTSALRVEDFKLEYDENEWIQGIEWEDDATQHRFLPSCKLLV